MKTIWKASLDPNTDHCVTLDMPEPFEVLSVQQVDSEIVLWAIVDDEAELVRRRFSFYGTEDPIPDTATRRTHLGTVQWTYFGDIVLHVFSEEEPA